jgi:hypothetical protein
LRRKLSSGFFLFLLQGKAQKETHVILKETLGEHAPWPSLTIGIFPPVMHLILNNPKQSPPRKENFEGKTTQKQQVALVLAQQPTSSPGTCNPE